MINHSLCSQTVNPPNTTISAALSQTDAVTVARRNSSQLTWIKVATIAHAVATITGTMSEAALAAAGTEPRTAAAQACASCGAALASRNATKKTTTGSRSSKIFKFGSRERQGTDAVRNRRGSIP